MERHRDRPTGRARFDTAGTGLFGTIVGFAVFMMLLLVAVQVIFDLYARSAVTAATFDAARRVASYDVVNRTSPEVQGAETNAEAHARRALGHYGQAAAFTWTITAEEVSLRVEVASPSLIPSGLSRPLGLDTIDRTVRVRAERVVCPPTLRCPKPSPGPFGSASARFPSPPLERVPVESA